MRGLSEFGDSQLNPRAFLGVKWIPTVLLRISLKMIWNRNAVQTTIHWQCIRGHGVQCSFHSLKYTRWSPVNEIYKKIHSFEHGTSHVKLLSLPVQPKRLPLPPIFLCHNVHSNPLLAMQHMFRSLTMLQPSIFFTRYKVY